MMLERYLLYYLIVINVVGLVAMGVDKSKARRRRRRIPEATLLTIGLVGGIAGIFIGMAAFHHKTRKASFIVKAMAILFLQVLLLIYLIDTGHLYREILFL